MSRIHRILAILLAGTVIFATGCDKDDNATNSIFADEYANQITIDYTLCGSKSRNEYTQASIKEFERQHPSIHVNLKFNDETGYDLYLDSMMRDGIEADVIQLNSCRIERYISEGYRFYDLNKFSDIINMDAFSKNALRFGSVGDSVYAIPVSLDTAGYIFNGSIYEEYGLGIPRTYDDLFEAAKIMRRDSVYPLQMDRQQLVSFLFTYAEQTSNVSDFDDNGNLVLSKNNAVKILDMYKSLLDERVIPSFDEYSGQRLIDMSAAGEYVPISDMQSSEAAIITAGGKPLVGNFLKKQGTLRLGYYVEPTCMLAISANTNHPKEAAMFINYLLNDSYNSRLQGCEKGIPVSLKAQMPLMENDMLNGSDYVASLYMNYSLGSFNIKPQILDDNDGLSELLNILNDYTNNRLNSDEAAKRMMSLGK